MTKITIEFELTAEGVNDAQATLDSIGELFTNAAPAAGTEKPKRTRSKRADTSTAAAPQAQTSAAAPAAPANAFDTLGLPAAGATAVVPTPAAVDPLAAIGGAAQLPPVATPAPVIVAAPVPPAVVGPPAEITQQNVLQSFIALGKTPKKGTDSVAKLLKQLGVATVPAIPKELWVKSIEMVRAELAA